MAKPSRLNPPISPPTTPSTPPIASTTSTTATIASTQSTSATTVLFPSDTFSTVISSMSSTTVDTITSVTSSTTAIQTIISTSQTTPQSTQPSSSVVVSSTQTTQTSNSAFSSTDNALNLPTTSSLLTQSPVTSTSVISAASGIADTSDPASGIAIVVASILIGIFGLVIAAGVIFWHHRIKQRRNNTLRTIRSNESTDRFQHPTPDPSMQETRISIVDNPWTRGRFSADNGRWMSDIESVTSIQTDEIEGWRNAGGSAIEVAEIVRIVPSKITSRQMEVSRFDEDTTEVSTISTRDTTLGQMDVLTFDEDATEISTSLVDSSRVTSDDQIYSVIVQGLGRPLL